METWRRSRWLGVVFLAVAMLVAVMGSPIDIVRADGGGGRSFQRVAHFPVFQNSDEGNTTVAEIIDVSKDGRGRPLSFEDRRVSSVGRAAVL